MSNDYQNPGPTREVIDAMPGSVLLEFGTPWCGHCQAAAPLVSQAMAGHHDITHIKVEDGPGRRLGRSLQVKLWPTLIMLKGGEERARVVRPTSEQEVEELLA